MTPVQKSNEDVELIKRLVAKTQEGKIEWSKHQDGYHAYIASAGMDLELKVSANPIFGTGWSRFSVHRGGELILDVNNENAGLLGLAGVSAGSLSSAVDQLFTILESIRRERIKSALSDLENL